MDEGAWSGSARLGGDSAAGHELSQLSEEGFGTPDYADDFAHAQRLRALLAHLAHRVRPSIGGPSLNDGREIDSWLPLVPSAGVLWRY